MLVKDHILLSFLEHTVPSQEEKAEPLLWFGSPEFFCKIGFHVHQILPCDVIGEVFHVLVDDPLVRIISGSEVICFDKSYWLENGSLIVLDLHDVRVALRDPFLLILVIDSIEFGLHYHNRDPMIRILDSSLELILPSVLLNHSVSFGDRGSILLLIKRRGRYLRQIQISGSFYSLAEQDIIKITA